MPKAMRFPCWQARHEPLERRQSGHGCVALVAWVQIDAGQEKTEGFDAVRAEIGQWRLKVLLIQLPGQTTVEGSAAPASVENGLLVEIRERGDLVRLTDLCGEIAFPASWKSAPGGGRLLPGSFRAAPFARLIGALMAGALSTWESEEAPESADELEKRVMSVGPSADKPFEGLIVALATIHRLWAPEDSIVVLVGLGLLADHGSDEVSVKLATPRAALWMAPGSLLAGISVGTTLKVAKWCALVVSPFTSTTAADASKRLVRNLRDRAQATSRHQALARLDALTAQDRTAIQGRPVLIVLLHGLFSTDLGTFDGFISHLRQSTPSRIVESLAMLEGSHGVDRLATLLKERFKNERLREVTDIELGQFVEANVALLGWPHDSLAPVDGAGIKLASLLNNAFKEAPPRHIVFVCHSQGGLLARAAALQLKQTQSPTNWADHVAGIVTYGTPHEGAAIAEPGFRGGREAAVYLMMLSGTRQATSIADVLTIVGERVPEGIEDLKAFDASTKEREKSFVATLLEKESTVMWPNGGNRPEMLIVGGKLGASQKDTWRQRLAAGFVSHKLSDADHDLVVELSSSRSGDVDPAVSIQVESDHFSYFDGDGRSGAAVDAAVALVWTLLAPEIEKWGSELQAADRARSQLHAEAVRRIKASLKPRDQSPPPPTEGDG
jgi:pimeloyl-ACP methyl ester carboxylesterase